MYHSRARLHSKYSPALCSLLTICACWLSFLKYILLPYCFAVPNNSLRAMCLILRHIKLHYICFLRYPFCFLIYTSYNKEPMVLLKMYLLKRIWHLVLCITSINIVLSNYKPTILVTIAAVVIEKWTIFYLFISFFQFQCTSVVILLSHRPIVL